MFDKLQRWVCVSSVLLAGCSAGGSRAGWRGTPGILGDSGGTAGITVGPPRGATCDGGVTIESTGPGLRTQGVNGDDCSEVIDWTDTADAGAPEEPEPPPAMSTKPGSPVTNRSPFTARFASNEPCVASSKASVLRTFCCWFEPIARG